MRIVVLSAHLDDAVFSAATQLLRPDARLVTVFAGPPDIASGRSCWDGLTRARSSAESAPKRASEDFGSPRR